MPALAFEEIHDFKATGYYAIPNEGTIQWRELLQGLRIHRAAGICSSGEVGFFALLPLVRKELVLVDHSLQSLHVAMVKYALLQRYSAKRVHEMFRKGNAKECSEMILTVKDLLPKQVQEAFKDRNGGNREVWLGSADSSPKNDYYATSHYDNSDRRQVQREWGQLPAELVQKAKERHDRVTFVHGDLRDLPSKGTFNLIYLSNALEHTSHHRNAKGFSWDTVVKVEQTDGAKEVQKAVKPGGYVALACRGSYSRHEDTRSEYRHIAGLGWTLVNELRGGSMGWAQRLYQVPA